ncbi:DUF2142 domain-containing protein [Cryobacterium glaciale]|uniref:DUF2142 domain-containing protein n=1 Tax=Cryobacterium glaciale TaxID=1259145 RepID=A0A4R8V017_9MICO|nr:DUF2142 domain-containing protein [Cryobacterium glaciale]TFB74336.1 DUF2142 domain-containing protein [Cryobacterium glaciale]
MKRSLAIFASAWLTLSLLAGAWAMATPISGAPDEPAHIIKAASVVRGQFVGTPSENGHTVNVPQYIASTHAVTCFAFQPEVAADCADSVPLGDDTIIPAETSAGLYNPVYYELVGWPSLLVNDESGIYLMRIVSGMVASAFLALSFVLIASWSRRVLPMLGLVVACTPMVFFLNGVVNPNSLETAATLAAFVALLSVVLQPNERLLNHRLIILVVSSAFAVNTRGLSPLWLAVVLVIPLALLSWKSLLALIGRKQVIWAIGAIFASTGVAILWMLSSNSLAAGISTDEVVTDYPGVGSSFLVGFVNVFSETFGFANGLVGQFGWLDTTAPAVTLFVWAALTGVLIIAAAAVLRGRRLTVFVLLAGSLVIIPALIQGVYITAGGFIWQGRYALPLFVCLVVGTAALISQSLTMTDRSVQRRLTGAILVTAAFAQIIAFAVVLQRYAVGSSGSLRDFYLDPAWQPPGGVLTWLAFYAITLLAGSILAFWWAWHESGPSSSHQIDNMNSQTDGRANGEGEDAATVQIYGQEEKRDHADSRSHPAR